MSIEAKLGALSCSAASGQTEAARELLASGADVNARNEQGLTPVMLAVLGGHLDTAVQLALSGADLTCRDAEGRTVLELAVMSANREVCCILVCSHFCTYFHAFGSAGISGTTAHCNREVQQAAFIAVAPTSSVATSRMGAGQSRQKWKGSVGGMCIITDNPLPVVIDWFCAGFVPLHVELRSCNSM